MAADVELGFSDQPVPWDHRRMMDETVFDVIKVCRRRGKSADPVVVRELVEREWVGYANARVQTFLPVLIGRAVSDRLLGSGSLLPDAPTIVATAADQDSLQPRA